MKKDLTKYLLPYKFWKGFYGQEYTRFSLGGSRNSVVNHFYSIKEVKIQQDEWIISSNDFHFYPTQIYKTAEGAMKRLDKFLIGRGCILIKPEDVDKYLVLI